jgi:hypothetical protein
MPLSLASFKLFLQLPQAVQDSFSVIQQQAKLSFKTQMTTYS